MNVGDPVESTPNLDAAWRLTGVVAARPRSGVVDVRITGAARHSDGVVAEPTDPWRRTGAVVRAAEKLWRPLNTPPAAAVERGMPTTKPGEPNPAFWGSADVEQRVGKALAADGTVLGPDPTIPSGLDVTVIRDDGSRWLTRTRSEPWQLGDGTWVILLEGKAGGYALDRVRRRREGDGA